MSRLRLNKITTPAVPAASKGELFYSSTLSPASPAWIDENGAVSRLGGAWTSGATAGQTGFATDTYLAGSGVNIGTIGSWKAGMFYRCVFDMVKTAAGTAAFVVTLRIGTLGTTGDAAIVTFTSATAQTAAIDTGTFIVNAQFRSVGSGTSAVVAGLLQLNHHLAITGLTQTGAAGHYTIPLASSGFNSTTSNFIGLSFNGGTSFAGTNVMCAATLEN